MLGEANGVSGGRKSDTSGGSDTRHPDIPPARCAPRVRSSTWRPPLTLKAPLIGRETRMLLRYYIEQGRSKRAIARKLKISRDTLYRWLREGALERDSDEQPVEYGPRRRSPRSSTLTSR